MKFETSRLVGFSDGIFAISITLLVLQLTIPDSPEDKLPAMLRATLHTLESWSLSFLVIGSLWVLHHQMIALIKVADTVLLWLNLLLLMCISLMPWSTDVVDTYRQEPLAIVIFSSTLGIAGLLLLAQWIYACRYGTLTADHVDERTRTRVKLLILRIPVVAILSIMLAFVNRSLGLWSWLLVSVFGGIIRRRR